MIIIASTTKHILDSYKLIFDKSFLGKFALVFFSQSSVNIEYIGGGILLSYCKRFLVLKSQLISYGLIFKNSKKARLG